MTFADKAILFNKQLKYTGRALPSGIRIMNPFEEFEQTMKIVETFYHKYYNDNKQRHLILGINPSRLGAGLLMEIKTKRIYEPPAESDGSRILVDRLWPRGMKKEAAPIDLWLKEVAPSNELRKWFNHEPEKFEQFVEKYQAELKGAAAFEELTALAKEHKILTLLFSAKDQQQNQAVVLKQFLAGHSGSV